MTLNCPSCGEEICDEFDRCPECHFDLKAYKDLPSDSAREEYAKSLRRPQAALEMPFDGLTRRCPACGAPLRRTDAACHRCWFDVGRYSGLDDQASRDAFLADFKAHAGSPDAGPARVETPPVRRRSDWEEVRQRIISTRRSILLFAVFLSVAIGYFVGPWVGLMVLTAGAVLCISYRRW